MTRPRQVLPGQFYFLTRRCAQRQFLLRPDKQTNHLYSYVLAVAAQRYEIDVLVSVAESNHHHTVIFDRQGNVSAFLAFFHGLVARGQNALRCRQENFWAAVDPCVTRVLDRTTLIDKLVYSITNPVKDLLVERVHQWPGVNTYKQLCSGKSLQLSRPRFFRADGAMPETIELRMRAPAELGDFAELIAEVRIRVDSVEKEIATKRRRTGARIIGRRQVLAAHWNQASTSEEPRCLRPRFAGRDPCRADALANYRVFLTAYRSARQLWRAGQPTVFPLGTWWLARNTPIPAYIRGPAHVDREEQEMQFASACSS